MGSGKDSRTARRTWLAGRIAILLAIVVVGAVAIPPGAKLPSGARCARWVRARPKPENKGVNRRFNRRTGQHVASNFLQGDRPAADRRIVARTPRGHETLEYHLLTNPGVEPGQV
jgi:hypothetical protein